MSLFFAHKSVIFGRACRVEMALSKQRKIDGERRVLQDTWTDQYFFITQKGNPVCLVCSETVEVTKPHTPAKQCIIGLLRIHVEFTLQSIRIRRRIKRRRRRRNEP